MDNFLWSAGAFAVAIAVLVTFHEFGHFWVARRLGVKVLRFSVGFGRPLWRRTGRDGVEYVVAWLPLGGYVKMLDEREGDVEESELPRAFNRQQLWKRAAIIFAGPLFNFVLAVLLYWVIWMAGVPGLKAFVAAPAAGTAAAEAGLAARDRVVDVEAKPVATWQDVRTAVLEAALGGRPLHMTVRDPAGTTRDVTLDMKHVRVAPEHLFGDVGLVPYQPPLLPVLDKVMPDTPAQRAGFQAGDRLLAYNGVTLQSWQQWVDYLRAHPGQNIAVKVRRGSGDQVLNLAVGTTHQDGKAVGVMGAAVTVPPDLWQDLQVVQRFGVFTALSAALHETWQMSVVTLQLGYRVATGDISLKNIGGPIRTAEAAGYSARVGWIAFVAFLAFVSINLGIVNLLPVPVLDGGHLLYCGIEAVLGAPLSERAQLAGQQFGLMLLAVLIGIVFYNDIASLVS
ncbi:MAG: RIP metalloprotease RseP [Nevskiaceae bacterium]|nr:MAG: RIP metalloprotease RseP [Nevskiaceae bacterium]TBR71782.1 MAG: RIP metalloprotease RseP [Nevskiaceae bacterium]